jgi:hypothetical protein
MGKVPCIEVDKGFLNEITAILKSFSPHIMEEVSMAGFFTSFFCLRLTYCQAVVGLGYCRRGGWT